MADGSLCCSSLDGFISIQWQSVHGGIINLGQFIDEVGNLFLISWNANTRQQFNSAFEKRMVEVLV